MHRSARRQTVRATSKAAAPVWEPGSDQSDSSHSIFVCLFGGFGHRLRVHETVFRRAGLVKRRLRAETAVFGTSAGLGVDNRAQMDFVALELLADAVCVGQQIKNVRGILKVKKKDRLLTRNRAAGQNTPAQFGYFLAICGVNLLYCHG